MTGTVSWQLKTVDLNVLAFLGDFLSFFESECWLFVVVAKFERGSRNILEAVNKLGNRKNGGEEAAKSLEGAGVSKCFEADSKRVLTCLKNWVGS